MPQLTCLCGYVHNLTPHPDHGYQLIRDVDHDAHFADLGAAFGGDRNAIGRTVDLWTRLYECPDCGRLAWFRDDLDRALFYAPEAPPEDAP